VPTPRGKDEDLATLFRKNEAARLWQRVVRAPMGTVSSIDRASAYAGLCLRAYDVGPSLESAASTLAEVRGTLGGFDAAAAFRAWTERTAMEARIERLRAGGKTPMPAELAKSRELSDKHDRAVALVNQAQEAIGNALKEFDALGADEARNTLGEVNETLAKLTSSAPATEAEAKELTQRTMRQLDVAENQRQKRVPMQSLLTYFYCKRADKIYSSLADMRTNRDLRGGAARVAYLLGLTLERRNPYDPEQPERTGWSCMTQLDLPRGFYSGAALRHYDRAVALAPEDAVIRCTAALTAERIGDPTRIRALEADSVARWSLAEQYLAEVGGATGKTADDGYRRAIAEYAAAIERNPNNVVALNSFAYMFWLWRYAWLREGADGPIPGPEFGERARRHAERALQLVEGKRPKMIEIAIRATVGEVLLALGRFEEAYAVLQRAVADGVVKEHAAYNEARWDLAQACLCVARDRAHARRGVAATEVKAQATKLLEEIRRIELGEEYRPFSTLVASGVRTDVCAADRRGPELPKPPRPAPVGRLAVR
jgi:tetratricopeptide (TPR) repeat protein